MQTTRKEDQQGGTNELHKQTHIFKKKKKKKRGPTDIEQSSRTFVVDIKKKRNSKYQIKTIHFKGEKKKSYTVVVEHDANQKIT